MTRALPKTIYIYLAAILTLLGMALSASAQNNPQRISDRLYPLYVKAYNLRKTPAALPIAETLRRSAIAAGDRYGECFAMQIQFLYEYYQPGNLDGLERALQPYMDKVRAYGFMSQYYYAVSMKTAYYTREKRYIEAFQYLREQTQLAEQRHDREGQCALYRMTGVIQHFRGELSQAIASYTQAIDMYLQYGYRRYISREYLSIADCYRMECNYEQLAATAERALPYCVTGADRANAAIYACYGYFMLGRYAEFVNRYEYLAEHKQKLDNSYVVMNKAIEACHAIYYHRNADAMRYIGEIAEVSPEESCRLYAAYYKYNGDYVRSIEYMQKLILARCELNAQTFAHDKASRDRIFSNQKLEAERQRIIERNVQLQLDNAQMSLHNSSLELGRSRDGARLARLEAERNALRYSHQQLRTRQLRDSIAAQRIVQQAKDRRLRMEHFVQLLLLAVAALIMLMTFVYIMRKRILARRLGEANRRLDESIAELNVAMDRAQQSDRMKTLFIQNMSHELRTPLNAVVGFSQLLTSDDSGLGEDEKRSMTKYIADNSDLLTTLVNDILDMTELQSGRYNINIETVAVNEMCRETIATVRHRLADGVLLRLDSPLPDAYTVRTDPHRVRQVLINLLTNAEKNTAEGSITLAASLKSHPGMLTLAVADTGRGVPKDKQRDIFKRFNKLDLDKQGTGLGLDICSTIVEKLGGEIAIDPEYTSGARFWFTIPLAQ